MFILTAQQTLDVGSDGSSSCLVVSSWFYSVCWNSSCATYTCRTHTQLAEQIPNKIRLTSQFQIGGQKNHIENYVVQSADT
jgi:hypothetical protein